MIDWRRYVLFEHLVPWAIVAVFVLLGFLTAGGSADPALNPFEGGQHQSTFRSGQQVGQALFYGFLGLGVGAVVDYAMRDRGD